MNNNASDRSLILFEIIAEELGSSLVILDNGRVITSLDMVPCMVLLPLMMRYLYR